MTERTLSQRELNRALLARQLLLQRGSMALPRAVERVCGLQTQYAPAGYIALRTRLEGFRRDDLTRALERRTVVQAWMMRSTIHMASKRDFWLFSAAVREQRRRQWSQAFRRAATAKDVAVAARNVERFLADGPKRRAQIVTPFGIDNPTWYGVMLWLDLVRVPPFGTWEQPRADLYALATDWLGDPPRVSEDEGIEHLVRRYLGAFGPATRADIASFTGLPAGALTPVLHAMKLRGFRDEGGKELLDLPRAPLPDPETPAPARFLPVWDATLLTQARRTQILPERYRSRVFNTKTPHSIHTFLVDGQVAGAWRFDGSRITLEPFEPLSKALRRELTDEAGRLVELSV
jgi:winged helix DNA-binding protein